MKETCKRLFSLNLALLLALGMLFSMPAQTASASESRTVTLHANFEGTGGEATATIGYEGEFDGWVLPTTIENTFSRTGYVLAGWSTTPEPSANIFLRWPGTVVYTNESNELTADFYAVWKEAPQSGDYAIYYPASSGYSHTADDILIQPVEDLTGVTLADEDVFGGQDTVFTWTPLTHGYSNFSNSDSRAFFAPGDTLSSPVVKGQAFVSGHQPYGQLAGTFILHGNGGTTTSGGTVIPAEVYGPGGSGVYLAPYEGTSFTYEGKILTSYNTLPDGSGDEIPLETALMLNDLYARGTKHLYAQWEDAPAEDYYTYYGAGGTSGIPPHKWATQTFDGSQNHTLVGDDLFTRPIAEKNGRKLIGWTTDPTSVYSYGMYDLDSEYSLPESSAMGFFPGTSIDLPSGTNFFAYWGYRGLDLYCPTVGDRPFPWFINYRMYPERTSALEDIVYDHGSDYSGHYFQGWNTEQDGTGTWFGACRTVSDVPKGTNSLYAQLAELPEEDYVLLDSIGGQFGGDGPSAKTVTPKGNTIVPENPIYPQGYQFIGWFTMPRGGLNSPAYLGLDIFKKDEAIPVSSGDTLYASVLPPQVSSSVVTFHKNGGTFQNAPDSESFLLAVWDYLNYTVSSSLFSTTPENKEFLGWNTAADGTGDWYYTNIIYDLDSFQTGMELYAQFGDKIVIDISKLEISDIPDQYPGKPLPVPTVMYDGIKLTEGKDYDILYSGDSDVIGNYTLSIRWIGRYSGDMVTDITWSVVKKPTPSGGGGGTVDPEPDEPKPAPGEVPTIEIDTAADGTVTTTTTWPDGKEAVAVKTPEGDKSITVTTPNGETLAEIAIPKEVGPAKEFGDVKADDWFKESVDKATGLGLFSGTTETSFSPNQNLTRGMLVTTLHRLSGTPEYGTGENVFADVKESDWYADATDWSNAVGVASGTDKGFEPNVSVTREQMVTMIYRYAKTVGANLKAEGSLSNFPDNGNVSAYAKEAMQWAVSVGIIQGRSGSIVPKGTATRAEVAAVLSRFVDFLAK